ncbi:MAG: nucleotide exchange factor GrpE [Spirochaetes bacterium]|jgi:molecular chaperone GrpE|nr:nucleotide exchange factor GrpE [Spirochaetota bacterium]
MAEVNDKTAEEKLVAEAEKQEEASVEEQCSEENSESTSEEVEDIIAKRDEEIAALKDLMMRRQADFENYKKRCVKQEETNKRMLIRDIALDVIEINDNLIRASEHALEVTSGEQLEEAHKSYVDGVMMISKSIETMLLKYNIDEIEAVGKPFDPNIHEAIEISAGEGIDEDTVTKVYQKGFKFDEFVLRSSKVQVTKPAAPGANDGEANEG